jgi:hypothetical protein
MRAAWNLLLAVSVSACMPPSVKVVDELLVGLREDDVERAAAAVHPDDREALRTCMEVRRSNPSSIESLALPAQPLSHHVVEIEKKTDDAHIVLVETTLKNPLPFAGERVGQRLDGIPTTRVMRQRYRSEKVGPESWAVRLDLPATLERARYVQHFQTSLKKGDLEEAARTLDRVPPPPNNPQSVAGQDRLRETLQAQLEEARQKAARDVLRSPD